MSELSRDYLQTRLTIYSNRLFGFERLASFIDYDLERIFAEVKQLSGHYYQSDDSNPGLVENQLTRQALEDFIILMRPFSGSERRFLFFAIRWFELANLKVLIRGKFNGIEISKIEQELIDVGQFADLPIKQLLETDDPYEMLRLLETSPYAGIVRQARRMYEEHGNDLFLLDATIDRSFFIDLNHRTRFLQDRGARQLSRVLGGLLDRFNLLWLLRYRFSYGLSAAKSFYLLTTTGNKLYSSELMRLARMDSIEEVVAGLPDPYRALLANIPVIADMETVMEYYSLSIAATALQAKSSLLTSSFAYIVLREAEVRFLQALIKGKRLQLGTELIKRAVGVPS